MKQLRGIINNLISKYLWYLPCASVFIVATDDTAESKETYCFGAQMLKKC